MIDFEIMYMYMYSTKSLHHDMTLCQGRSFRYKGVHMYFVDSRVEGAMGIIIHLSILGM